MTQEEYNKFKFKLEKRGYKQYPSINNADYAYYKSFGKSTHEEDRSNYQICFDIYDFGKYANREPYFVKNPYGVTPLVLMSRSINERIDLTLSHIGIEDNEIDKIEQLAESFYQWVEKEIKI